MEQLFTLMLIIAMAVCPLLRLHAAPAVLVSSDATSGFVPQSNANSMIYTGPSSCLRFNGLSVSVQTSSHLQSDRGFSIQLNGYSPSGYTAAWQQYGFTVDAASGVNVFAENWKLPVVGTDDLFNVRPSLFQLASPPTVPSNYLFNISLLYDIVNGGDDVIGAHYSVYDRDSSSTVGSLSLMLRDIEGFDPTWYAPVVAFQMNIVGPYNALGTTFSAASGHIFYSADSYLTTLTGPEPSSCVAAPNIITAETSNVGYSDLSGQLLPPTTAFSQAFFIL